MKIFEKLMIIFLGCFGTISIASTNPHDYDFLYKCPGNVLGIEEVRYYIEKILQFKAEEAKNFSILMDLFSANLIQPEVLNNALSQLGVLEKEDQVQGVKYAFRLFDYLRLLAHSSELTRSNASQFFSSDVVNQFTRFSLFKDNQAILDNNFHLPNYAIYEKFYITQEIEINGKSVKILIPKPGFEITNSIPESLALSKDIVLAKSSLLNLVHNFKYYLLGAMDAHAAITEENNEASKLTWAFFVQQFLSDFAIESSRLQLALPYVVDGENVTPFVSLGQFKKDHPDLWPASLNSVLDLLLDAMTELGFNQNDPNYKKIKTLVDALKQ
ncbi:MAG: hypothetical protein QE271_13320 [Bacteriovoracaceae bacterium]|nr:hypothetical protein [Bacteriovoracaceae bacterium]